jgi:hypothetical protein
MCLIRSGLEIRREVTMWFTTEPETS